MVCLLQPPIPEVPRSNLVQALCRTFPTELNPGAVQIELEIFHKLLVEYDKELKNLADAATLYPHKLTGSGVQT